jgi:hypothetical protein
MSVRLYYDDAYLTEFTASVIGRYEALMGNKPFAGPKLFLPHLGRAAA